MKKTAAFVLVVALLLLPSVAAFAQSNDELKEIRKEINELKAGQAGIQKDLKEIKELLNARRARPQTAEAKNVVLSVLDAPMKGDTKALLTLIEFSDYQ